jgi:tetratricopeptide (TPR) repeat protein
MKNNRLYTFTLLFFVIALSAIVYKYKADKKKESAVQYKLKERTGPASLTTKWTTTRKKAEYLTEAIQKNPDKTKARIGLSALFIEEARITGDYLYYDKAAMKYAEDVLKKDSDNFEALTLKALIHMSQHHFADGLAVAEKAKKINPYNAFVYGILVDGNVEMGNYGEAVVNSDKMVSIRPDLRSYSRIAYLREIHGDYPGAIEAMKLAVEAGSAGDEATEWCRVQLGQLYENISDIPNAEMQYNISLDERPGYAYALAGLGRIERERKNYPKSLQYFMQADSSISGYVFKEEMVELYHLSGEQEKADQLAKEVIDEMLTLTKKSEADPTAGHYADRELAIAFMNVKDYDNALKHALLEYNRRPSNIDVNETVAWVYYNKGQAAEALQFLQRAMKTHSRNPTLLCRAALIYNQTGNKDAAKAIFREVLSKKPNIQVDLESASRKAMSML